MTERFDVPPAGRQAEQQPRTGSARPGDGGYRLLFDANPQPMWVYDARTLAFLAVNDAAVREYGYRRDEFLAMTIEDIRPAEDRSLLLERLAATPAASAAESAALLPAGTFRHHRKDGSLLDVEVFSEPVLFDGREARLVIARDVTERKQAAEALLEREAQLSEAQRLARLGSWEWDRHHGVRVSEEMARIFGVDPTVPSMTAREALRFVHPDDRELVSAGLRRTDERRETFAADVRVVRADGEERQVEIRAHPVVDDAGRPLRIYGTARDVTEQRRLEEALEERARLARLAVDLATALAADDPAPQMLRRCCEALVSHLDAACARIWTLSDDRSTLELQAAAGLSTDLEAAHASVPVGHSEIGRIAATGEAHLTNTLVGDPLVDQEWAHREGMTAFAGYPLAVDGRLFGVMAVFARHPLSEAVLAAMAPAAQEIAVGIERKRNEAALVHQALHDALTGLPNRSLILDRLGQALARARRRSSRCAVLLLDLDHFKIINETRGHGAGDRLLLAVAERLRRVVRPADTVARLGGDEFAVLCEDVVSEWEATCLGQRIASVLEPPFVVDGFEHFVTASLGAVLADPATSPEAVLRHADAAMYQAKQQGRARLAIFDETFSARAAARVETEAALRRAVERREFSLVYQPIVDLDEGRIVGAEALLRWRHPDRGLVSPAAFIPLAEETGIIVSIGAWVLDEACRQGARWRTEGGGRPPLSVSVNLSARQLLVPDFLDRVAGVLSEHGVDPANLHLEITETVLMDDADFSVETLAALKALGVRIAIDDFGTGYSSLAYLRRFPVDKIKIDRSFVSGPGDGGERWPIVSAIIGMSRALDRLVLAEGVETAEQLARLRAMGCQFGQGYLFAPPLPADDFADFVASRPRW